MKALVIILSVIDIIICITLVCLVMLQDSKSQGLGSIAGGAETFFGQGKAGTKEEKLRKLTEITAVSFAILSMVLYVLLGLLSKTV